MEEQTRTATSSSVAPRPTMRTAGGGGNFVRMLISVVVLIIVLGGGFFLFRNFRSGVVDTGKYQAVFLSNGQVYFGKLKGLNTAYPTLSDIYYLIIRRPLQSQELEATEAAVPQTPQYTLIKLGRELHGPVDKMVINRNHVLFVEDLKEDGRVTQAIRQSQQQGETEQPAPIEQPIEGE